MAIKNKIRVVDLTKKFSANEGIENINLEIKEGEFLTLLGPSGCGKTTILRAIGGFNKIDNGEIWLDNKKIHQLPPEKRKTGMVFQSYNLWPHMTIYENMAFGLKLRKFSKAKIKTKISETLALVNMTGSEKKYPAQLSGGQQQRIAIARSLVLNPEVLLLDEPFSALDAKIREQMREELKRIQVETGLTVLFVTHDQEEALAMSDRIAVMNAGKIVQIATPKEIYNQPATEFVASFVGHMNFMEENGKKYAVRPEDILLLPENQNENTGEIETIMLLGHYGQIFIRTKDEKRIKVFADKETTLNYEVKQKVCFSIQNKNEFGEE